MTINHWQPLIHSCLLEVFFFSSCCHQHKSMLKNNLKDLFKCNVIVPCDKSHVVWPFTAPLASLSTWRPACFPPTKNGIESYLFPLFVPPREIRKKFPPSFHPSTYLDFEINFPSGASRAISTFKMSQMVEILILDLVLILD